MTDRSPADDNTGAGTRARFPGSRYGELWPGEGENFPPAAASASSSSPLFLSVSSLAILAAIYPLDPDTSKVSKGAAYFGNTRLPSPLLSAARFRWRGGIKRSC